jgi:gliding motility-associated-like protein
MRSKLLHIYIFSLLFQTGLSQSRNNIWYFGDKAGIDFNSANPIILTNGQLVHAEGIASISDQSGRLEFYTNGIKVWNADNQTMFNGNGLLGNNSTSQILIVPKPGDCTKYYIFVPPTQGDEGFLSYNEVDMTKQNGLGEVVQKNVVVKTGGTERICATLKANNRDYWVVVQGSDDNKYYSYSVTDAGVNLTPVISSAGLSYFGADRVGVIKFSPSGNKMVVTNGNGQKICQLFDFDIATGTVTNPIELAQFSTYGAEFSVNGNKLYTSSYDDYAVHQFSVDAGSAAAIVASKIELFFDPTLKGGAMQLATDGKIYVCKANKPFLDVINFPNNVGIACGFTVNGLNLLGRVGLAGMPNFIKAYSFANNCGKLIAQYEPQGCGNNFKITLSAQFGQAPYTYSLDGTNYQSSPVFLNQASGDKIAYAKDANQILKQVAIKILDNQSINIKEIKITQNLICGQKNGSLEVEIENGLAPILYSLDGINFQTNNSFTSLKDSTYIVTIKDQNGCTTNKSVTIIPLALPKIYAGADTFVFIGNDAILKAIDLNNAGFSSYKWQPSYNIANPLLQSTTALVDKDIEYTVIAKNTISGCETSDKIQIRVVTDADIYIPNTFTPNNDGLNDLLRPLPIGITNFKYLSIYDRLGKLVFTTTQKNGFWDGKINGALQNSGTYVFVTEGIDYKGRKVYKKGTINLVR